MKKVLISALLAGALALPATSYAHFGGIWYDTAVNTSRNITAKYPKIVSAQCSALWQTWAKDAFNAHSRLTNDTRRWDHFYCAVQPKYAPSCVVLAHIGGRQWSDFYLTSYPHWGCRPYDIR